jgi:thiol-disulfide isomerase/thioredoxin
MALTYTPNPVLGSLCHDFSLPGTDGRVHTRDEHSKKNGHPVQAMLVMFICNHCPYVKAIEERLVRLGKEFADRPVSIVAISANDGERYPEDSFEKMKLKNYPFPYLYDESQSVAAKFGAVCTPDFFLYDKDLKLAYRGRLDDSWKDPSLVRSRDLAGAIESLLQGMRPTLEQRSSMGCSIKWKPGNEPPPAKPF